MYRSKDLNLPFPTSTGSSYNKHGKEEFDLPPQIHKVNSGLLRYQSAPSSFIGDLCEEFFPYRPTSPVATESMFARFMTEKLPSAAASVGHRSSRTHLMMPSVAEEAPTDGSGGGVVHSSILQMPFHSPQQEQSLSCASAMVVDGLMDLIGAEAEEQGKNGGGSSLIRHSSSPAGFFSHLNVDIGSNMMIGTLGFRPGSSSNAESNAGANGRLKGHVTCHSNESSPAFMSQSSDTGNDSIGGGRSSPQDDVGSRYYLPDYHPIAPWEETVLLSDNFSGGKRPRDSSESGGDMRSHISNLTHHLSLPKSSPEMSAMDRLFQLQDAVPYKIRAKRGFATHPRSIAERVRRTKISERIRKLQELVPNLDKQTNTADMLDLSVEYIKGLQNTVKTLSDDRSRSRCTCSGKQKT